jgi:hypothetical protein
MYFSKIFTTLALGAMLSTALPLDTREPAIGTQSLSLAV